ncbi:F-box associated interaction domain [Arabidopsis suecica]|uniref:F-box associated interaction domain n=1 Tax=Arabidopsis suecica TaxID=45249 RepID=A0A8T2B6N9_ARASU|nr:F-box associated interaction domain [Arabidopsis suecica]
MARRRAKSKTLSFQRIQSSTKMLPELPKDLVEEILCRVTATSLNRLRTTCRAWNRLIEDDRRFATKHLEKAPKEFIPLMLRKEYRVFPFSVNHHKNDPSVVFKREVKLIYRLSNYRFRIDRVFHCDGLLLCTSDENESRIVVWNPFTRETRWIEAGLKRRDFTFLLGYSQVTSSKSYKILSFRSGRNDSEIYDLNSDSWRRLFDNDHSLELTVRYSGHSVSLKGNIYRFYGEETGTKSLLRFDFATEKSEILPLPYQCDSYDAKILSVVGEDKLSVLLKRCRKGSKTEIWVTNGIDDTTKAVSWTKVLALNLSKELQITDRGSFLLDEEKKVVQICERWFDNGDDENYNSDMLYVVGEGKKDLITVYEVPDIRVCWPAILNYVPSFAQIKLAGGKRKRGH